MANRDTTPVENAQIEQLIDSAGLESVLQAISEICGEKAEHIRANWQDNVSAKRWDSAAGVVGVASTHAHVATVSR